ncbi:hypothetical protein QTP86_009298 [Hemibagrus guttatus]|nr:hypothetical protein QTP86_009298 [Hemibagrus guttatus]
MLYSSICQWISSFLTDRHQLVKLGKFTSYSCTGTPQGCILSPLLFSLYTNDCTSTDPSVKLLKFVDDTTVIGLIQDGDESAYRQEIEHLAAWCSLNNLELNTLKRVEMIVDFRRNTPALPPLTIMNSTVPTVESFRFLGTTISQDLNQTPNSTMAKTKELSKDTRNKIADLHQAGKTESAIGVAEKYVRVVQDMYERSRTVVKCAVGQTEEFKVEVGLHQGSALSPFLFAIVMVQLSEEVRQESPWTIMFADDIVICSESREQVEENLERWRFVLERRGMKVSHVCE